MPRASVNLPLDESPVLLKYKPNGTDTQYENGFDNAAWVTSVKLVQRYSTSNYPPVFRAFLDALRADLRSLKTQWTYMQALELLEQYREEQGLPDVVSLEREHIIGFSLWLQARPGKRGPLKPATLLNRRAAIKGFYKWLIEEGYRENRGNPVDAWKRPKIPDEEMPDYGAEDIKALLGSIGKRLPIDIRDQAIIRLMYDTGMRAHEVCGLQTDDLDLDGLRARVVGKGRKERVVVFGYRCSQSVNRYLRIRDSLPNASRLPQVFITREGGAMTYETVRHMLSRRFRDAGMKSLGAHAFRRAWALDQLDQGMRERDLMVLAGWGSLQMVDVYTKRKKKERAIEAYRSPGDRL